MGGILKHPLFGIVLHQPNYNVSPSGRLITINVMNILSKTYRGLLHCFYKSPDEKSINFASNFYVFLLALTVKWLMDQYFIHK